MKTSADLSADQVGSGGEAAAHDQEHQAEDLICKILDSYLKQNFDNILEEAGDKESKWTKFLNLAAEAAAQS